MPETRNQEKQRSEKDIQKDLIRATKEMEDVIIKILPITDTEIEQWKSLIEEAEKSPVTVSPKSKKLVTVAKNNLNTLLKSLPGETEGTESDTAPEAGAENAAQNAAEKGSSDLSDEEMGKIGKKIEEKKNELRIKLEQAIEAMRELKNNRDNIDHFTEEELNAWKAIVNEAQDVENQLTEKTEALMHEAADLTAFLGDARRTRNNLTEAIKEAEEISRRTDRPRASEKEIEKLLKTLNKAQDRQTLLSTDGNDLMYKLSDLLSDLKSDRKKTANKPEKTRESAEKYQPKDWRIILNEILQANPDQERIKIRTGKHRITKIELQILKIASNPEEYAAHGITDDLPNDQELEAIRSILDAVNEYSVLKSGMDSFPLAEDSDSAEAGTASENETDVDFGLNNEDNEAENKDGNGAETENKDQDRYHVLKIHNRIKLKRLLKGYAPENIGTEEINREVEKQGEFVRTEAVEDLFAGNNQRELLEGLLFAEVGSEEYEKTKKIIAEALIEAGLILGDDSQQKAYQAAEELISRQREKISESANIALSQEAAAKFSWKKFGAKTSLIVGLGYAVAFGGGGIPGAMALAAGRIGVSFYENIRQERRRKALIEQKRNELRNEDKKAANFLETFFADIAISKQEQINDVPWSGPNGDNLFEQFDQANPEAFGDYTEEEKESLIASLKALDRINEINNRREKDVLEKISDLVKKKMKLVSEISNFFENNRFVRFGKDVSPEAKAVSAAAWSAASIMARSLPGVRNVFLAMAGWKVGGALADMASRGITKEEEIKINLTDKADDVLVKLEKLNKEKFKGGAVKNAKAGMKVAGAILGALLPEVMAELTGSNEAAAETPKTTEDGLSKAPEAATVPGSEAIAASHGSSSGSASEAAEKIIKPGYKKYDFEGTPGVAPGMPGEDTYSGGEEGEIEEDILSKKVTEAGGARPTAGSGVEETAGKPGTPTSREEGPFADSGKRPGWDGGRSGAGETVPISDNAGEPEDLVGESGNAGDDGKNPFSEFKRGAGWDGGRSGAGEVAPTLDSLSEKMSRVDGKSARHLWGLIEDKVEAAVGNSYGDLKDSEGRMTYIVDAIKDRIGDDPEKFGLPKGTNIDVLTKEQLLALASSDEFDSQLSGLLVDEKHGLIEAAESLNESAVKNIENNNQFYRQNVARLDASGGLGQEDYDLMDKMRNGASEAARQGGASGAATINEASSGISETLGSTTNRASELISGYTPTDTETAFPAFNFDANDKGSQAWIDLAEKIRSSSDRSDITKSLENVFRQTDLEEIYDKEFHSPFYVQGVKKVADYLSGRELLLFETPYPAEAEDANALGAVKFEYDPVSNRLLGFHGGKYFGGNFSESIPLTKKLELIIEDVRLSKK